MNDSKIILNLVAEIGTLDDINRIRRLVLDAIRNVIWFDTANSWLYPPVHGWEQHVVMDTPEKSLNTYLHHYANSDEFHQAYDNSNITIARSTELWDQPLPQRRVVYYVRAVPVDSSNQPIGDPASVFQCCTGKKLQRLKTLLL